MLSRAVTEKRSWLVASLIAGISYFFVRHEGVPALVLMAWKGAGVALLAIYALASHESSASRQIAAVMAFGALGDVLIELVLEWGAIAFLIGHLVAIRLYWRNRRGRLEWSQKLAALSLAVLIPVSSFLLPHDRAAAFGVAVYSAGLGVMAATAWFNSFSRYRVGIGAVMFAVSDLLIFSRMGPLSQSPVPDILIWPLYYFGQILICTGIIGDLRQRDATV